MEPNQLNWIANFIWGIADDVLRDFFKRGKYPDVDLLKEYRTRLTADVVTGKLDVREAARQLPEEAAEIEAAPDTEELSEPEPEETNDANN